MNKKDRRQKRKLHIRKKISGTADVPRVFVFKSNRYFYAGAANDDTSTVIMSKMSKKKAEDIKKMAKEFATSLKKKKIDKGVFDRSGYRYHGLVALFADELRNNGIKI
ncbi:MAG TPA: 50S ribosomal protein L18 [Candidatus Dojkabacteria bacterium]|jgi:large subunit ribosomal protein L18|nr:50S ribosomal protein L18 [Candidatus Dojkabacteria bacterium]HQA87681.1 50S ribosomal protein L18 [Candidatus Dojkabacteria bacterium]